MEVSHLLVSPKVMGEIFPMLNFPLAVSRAAFAFSIQNYLFPNHYSFNGPQERSQTWLSLSDELPSDVLPSLDLCFNGNTVFLRL